VDKASALPKFFGTPCKPILNFAISNNSKFRIFSTKQNSKFQVNYTVLLLFISELFFVIIPAALYLHFQSSPIPVINLNSGTAVSIGFCIDGLLVSLVYWQTIQRGANKINSSAQRAAQPT
jgi:protein-S-isoprenylcysteine O-methyltransferase Ste14